MAGRFEAFSTGIDRRIAPFEAAAVLGAIALAFPWHLSFVLATVLVAVLLAICGLLVLGAWRGWPPLLNLVLAGAALALVLWPWAGPGRLVRAAMAVFVLAILAGLHYLPWQRLPQWGQAAIPAGAGVCIGILGYVYQSAPALVFPLFLLAVLWAALSHRRPQLAVVLIVCLAAQLALAAGHRDWLVQVPLFGGLLILVGGSVHVLVSRTRQDAAGSAAVAEVLRALVEGRDSTAIRESLCSILAELLDAPSVIVFELDAAAGMLVPTAAKPRLPGIKVSLDGEVFDADGHSLGRPDPPAAVWEAFRRGETVFRPSLRRMARSGELRAQEEQSGIRSVLCQPVHRDGRPAAVLVVSWTRGVNQVPLEQVELVGRLADQVGLLLVQADLRSQVETLARIDGLTGVANRRYWEDQLALALTRARREHHPVCVAVLDLDRFKAVNDDLGHAAGDRLLREVAQLWKGGLRELDLLGRYGGDEFAILLPNCEVEEAMDVLDRLRVLTFDQAPFSAGLAAWEGEEASQILIRADSALYEAKHAGGGQTWVATGGSAEAQPWLQAVHGVIGGGEILVARQPIQRLADGVIVAEEALARVPGLGEEIEPLFQAARRAGLSRDLDWICRREAIVRAADSGLPIFVNVGVWGLLDRRHRPEALALLAEGAGRAPRDVVLELSERDRLNDTRVVDAVKEYRACGFRFALDDLGSGDSNLEMLVNLDASFLKLASPLLQATDVRSQAAIKALIHFAHETGGEVIAEGLETRAQLQRARELGIDLGQGYLLRRPSVGAK